MSSVWPDMKTTRSSGARRRCLVGELLAGHARHDDVGDEHVDRLPARERLVAARRLAHVVACASRIRTAWRRTGSWSSTTSTRGRRRARRAPALGSRRRGTALAAAGRKIVTSVPAAGVRVDLDVAAGVGDDAVDGGEAEAGALARLLRREERLEGARRDLAAMPAPVVGDGDPRRRPVAPGHGDRQRPAVGHRVARVDGEVDEHLLELGAVGEDRQAAPGPTRDPQRDALAERAVEQALEVAHERADVERPRGVTTSRRLNISSWRVSAAARSAARADLLDVVADRVVAARARAGRSRRRSGSPTAGC